MSVLGNANFEVLVQMYDEMKLRSIAGWTTKNWKRPIVVGRRIQHIAHHEKEPTTALNLIGGAAMRALPVAENCRRRFYTETVSTTPRGGEAPRRKV